MSVEFFKIKSNWASKTFWTLNDEMQPRNKVTFVREIDASPMDSLRESTKEASGIKPSYTAVIVEAATRILAEFPITNQIILGPFFWKQLYRFQNIDITVAVEKDLPGAEAVVLAHTIRSCDKLSSIEITQNLQKALDSENERWQMFTRVLKYIPPIFAKWILRIPCYFPSLWVQHRGGACFVNSPAKYGVDLVVADMIWPITFSFGEVKLRPIVIEGKLEVRRTIPLVMIFDRRIMQGAIAARIFNRYCEILS